jgi:hypothetical protein
MKDKNDNKTTPEIVRQEIVEQLNRIATIESVDQCPNVKQKPWWKRIFSK